MKRFLAVCLPSLFAVFFLACTTNLKPLTEKTAVPRDQSIFILGVNWVETYNDLERKEDAARRDGFRFYEAREAQKTANRDLPEAAQKKLDPLHLHSVRLVFNGSVDAALSTVFYNPLASFHKFQAFTVAPQTLTLDQVQFTGTLLNLDPLSEVIKRRNDTLFRVTPPAGRAAVLAPGRVYYLGTLTVYVQSKHRWFGFFPNEEVIESMTVTGWEVADEFDAMKAYFAEHFAWFPQGDIENLAEPAQFEYRDGNWEPTTGDALKGIEPARDSEKFFY